MVAVALTWLVEANVRKFPDRRAVPLGDEQVEIHLR